MVASVSGRVVLPGLDQVQAQLGQVGKAGQQSGAQVAQGLSAAAVETEKLNAAFGRIGQAIENLGVLNGAVSKLAETTEQRFQQIGQAIDGIQFANIGNQLDEIRQRGVRSLEELLAETTKVKAGFTSFANLGEAVQQLNRLNGVATNLNSTLNNLRSRSSQATEETNKLGEQAQQTGNKTRAALLAAMNETGEAGKRLGSGLRGANDNIEKTGVSAAATRYAVQNLSFQINDVVTSLASGISPFRTFTQQGGQFVQLFEQGGGVGNVLKSAAERFTSLLTPTRLVIVAFTTVAAGIGALVLAFHNSEVAVRSFDAILTLTGRTSLTTGKNLEEAAHSLHGVGVSVSEARKEFVQFLSVGGDPRFVQDVTKARAQFDAVLGKGFGQQFSDAVAQGGNALEDFDKKLNIIPKDVQDVQKNLDDLAKKFAEDAEAIRQTGFKIQDALRNQGRALEDERRRTQQSLDDITRNRNNALRLQQDIANINQQFQPRIAGATSPEGAAQEQAQRDSLIKDAQNASQRKEILFQQARQESELAIRNRREIQDIYDLAAREQNERHRKALEDYNAATLAAAQKEGDDIRNRRLAEIAVDQAYDRINVGLSKSVREFSSAWSKAAENVENSYIVKGLSKVLGVIIKGLVDAGTYLLNLFNKIDLSKLIESFEKFGKLFEPLYNALKNSFIDGAIKLFGDLTAVINGIISLLEKALDLLNKLKGDKKIGEISDQTGVPAGSTGGTGLAGGGLARGPGTGTSDSIWARISNGEFVVNAAATRMNLPLLRAINSMNRPIIPNARGFAAGGLAQLIANQTIPDASVGLVNQHTRFTLVIEGRHYADLLAPEETANNLEQHARTSSILSLGRSPSWKP